MKNLFSTFACSILVIGVLCRAGAAEKVLDIHDLKDANEILEVHEQYLEAFVRPLQRARPLRGFAPLRTDPSGPILDDPDFEKRLWDQLAKDAVETRKFAELRIAMKEVNSLLRRAESGLVEPGEPTVEELWPKYMLLQNQLASVERARTRIGGVQLNFEYLRDARGVRLIAPLLDEPDVGEPSPDPTESRLSLPKSVMRTLRDMIEAGVFKAEGLPITGQLPLSKYRDWWHAHRDEFGPVYELPKTNPEPEPPARNVLLRPNEPQAAPPDAKVAAPDQPLAAVSTSPLQYRYWIFLAVALLILAGAFLYRALQQRKSAGK